MIDDRDWLDVYLATAQARFTFIPRKIIGSLKSDRELVIAVYAELMCDNDYAPFQNSNDTGEEASRTLNALIRLKANVTANLNRVVKDLGIPFYSEKRHYISERSEGELLMWMSYTGNPELHLLSSHDGEVVSRMSDWADLLAGVVYKPERLRYAEAGLCDITVIDRFIADGVDPELASMTAVGVSAP